MVRSSATAVPIEARQTDPLCLQAASGAAGEATCARSGLVGGTRVEGIRGGQLAAGDDEDVDAGGTGLLETRRTIRPPTAMCGQLRWMGPIRIWVISCCRAKPTMARAESSCCISCQ